MEYNNHVVFKRRSIRKFTGESIKPEWVSLLLRAAQAAPSAGNAQPWYFHVIKNKEILNQIASRHPYARMASQAGVGIVVSGLPEKEKYIGFWVQDCAAATMNILIEAEEIGLGAVWVGVYPNENFVNIFRELLNLPQGIIPLSFIPIGVKAEEKPPSGRYDESKIKFYR